MIWNALEHFTNSRAINAMVKKYEFRQITHDVLAERPIRFSLAQLFWDEICVIMVRSL